MPHPPSKKNWLIFATVAIAAISARLILAYNFFNFDFESWAKVTIPRWQRRVIFCATAYGLFAISFLPYLFANGAIAGVWKNVITYQGMQPRPLLLPGILDLLAPWTFAHPVINARSMQIVFVLCMCFLGTWLAKRSSQRLLELYLLSLVIFSCAMADQYLAIPMIVCALAWRHWASWAYTAVSIVVLIVSGDNVGILLAPVQNFLRFRGSLTYLHAQLCLLILLIFWIRGDGSRAVTAAWPASLSGKSDTD